MYALHARYRGRERRRAQFVTQSAKALSTLEGVGEFQVLGVEDISAEIHTAAAVTDTTMALLSAGDWAVSIAAVAGEGSPLPELGAASDAPSAAQLLAQRELGAHARAGSVKVAIQGYGQGEQQLASNISGTFTMLAYILAKRTAEGREATSLMRAGLNQNEAAEELGISKQAMSQRLQAAGWQAELAGYQIALSLLSQAR
ncbi:MarR family transcriptional regulator [Corynebacterium sp. 153RC1]|uniref:MarR family transcriptional regulator n=1 Tax=Corynebacterium TaxID=1716 RepID=UPI00211BDE4C|nr:MULTISPECIES: MarR family transcriptional regulator [unclassified Corynebacterium]MCQ9369755.1 MarR family transcriptional regulator [Corynebacterium sp. 35RC1]MCQ9342849.1 MarR family transcriptional regulator [Corynebacterium sp. 76QC2CO]MCQ9352414.1 MarR family transcriptional regulator [Corynebacterium sp. 209RC1]MCQ9354414.1 MarR family transcriptional regulator [Corynebacterium sp. 1222RC1]MCQ9356697.1 MarR family transcriptional regulator [Corynebacterium sp. 122RC1]